MEKHGEQIVINTNNLLKTHFTDHYNWHKMNKLSSFFLSFIHECPPDFKPMYYRRYVNDSFSLLKVMTKLFIFKITLTINICKIKCIFERENNRNLAFLDCLLTRKNNEFESSTY